jgi:hypothetical protein
MSQAVSVHLAAGASVYSRVDGHLRQLEYTLAYTKTSTTLEFYICLSPYV